MSVRSSFVRLAGAGNERETDAGRAGGKALGSTVGLAYREKGGPVALEIYFQEDIAQSIVAVTVGMLTAAAAHGLTNVEYARGIIDFARAQALNYRIPWSHLQGELRGALGDRGCEDILDALAVRAPIVEATKILAES